MQKISCAGCLAVIERELGACPMCGRTIPRSLSAPPIPGRRSLEQSRNRNRAAKYAVVVGDSATHVTGKTKASKSSGGLPSLGKRR